MPMTATANPSAPARKKSLLESLEVDTRLLGMIGAFVALCLVFNFITDGRFLTPRNIFNLTIQTVSVAIMATGMVFIIVTRHIDLSVGSLLATCSAVMAMTQTVVLPQWMGLGLGHWAITPWPSRPGSSLARPSGPSTAGSWATLPFPPSSSRWAGFSSGGTWAGT
jgi:D-xylose transport system permease protein